ncbi:MAG: hypothetical protein H6736_03445 [Alphaproteobacteria bacterium]|nr:hypothetical protein [Alphaproteobacteria bacterium]MCB9690850.1 hypothetical protein [Alphaproteobacteria bacterium]
MGGKSRHDEKKAALAALGRPLSRRARSRCELCEANQGLQPVLLRASEEPELENVLLLCGRCADVVRGGRIDAPDDLRFLEQVVWSEVPVQQAVAVRMLARVDAPWADVTRENLWVDEAVQALADGLDPA